MGDGVKVELTALLQFAQDIGVTTGNRNADGSAKDPGVTLTTELLRTASFRGLTARMRASTGAEDSASQGVCLPSAFGMQEAQWFSLRHERTAQAVMELMSEALRGLSSLGAAASVCAFRYADTDQLNARDLGQVDLSDADVSAAFTPGPKDQALFPPEAEAAPTAVRPAGQVHEVDPDSEAGQAFGALTEQQKRLIAQGADPDAGLPAAPIPGAAASTFGASMGAIPVPADTTVMQRTAPEPAGSTRKRRTPSTESSGAPAPTSAAQPTGSPARPTTGAPSPSSPGPGAASPATPATSAQTPPTPPPAAAPTVAPTPTAGR